VEFEWDAKKEVINLEKHKMDFEFATAIFLDPDRVVCEDNRFDYGEQRLITFGQIADRLHVVVYVEKDAVTRIISARKANKRERQYHENR
jgi:uncharacterized DUF497 family protein